jgi:hypothetical protein
MMGRENPQAQLVLVKTFFEFLCWCNVVCVYLLLDDCDIVEISFHKPEDCFVAAHHVLYKLFMHFDLYNSFHALPPL